MIARFPPEQGQLVEVRLRRYVVSQVQQNTLPSDPLKIPANTPHHLVTLNSVEDDALGEELQVIWERDLGVQVIEQGSLPSPTGFDNPDHFDAFLDAVRWGAIASADVKTLQAPFRSGITIEDYQLDPLVRAITMPRVNLLIADDVGLGKTIEAGLVLQELILRYRVRTVLIVCPSALQIQWREQMRDKFGLDFRIIDTARMRTLRRERGLHVNPWTHYPRLITSMDYLKRERPMRLWSEVLPANPTYPRPFDMLIVDECHNIAPARSGSYYATDSLRTKAIRCLVPHFEHRLFLSATPHNGYPESFTALLELLDDQRFARGIALEKPSIREQIRTIMVRRLKSELPPDDFGAPRFPTRQIEAIEVAYQPEERQIHTTLQQYTHARQTNARDKTEQVATDFVLKLLKKRLFSSPEAFAKTLAQHQKTLQTARRSGSAVFIRPSLSGLRQHIDQVEEEFGDDEEAEETIADVVDVSTLFFTPLTLEEEALITKMQSWAKHARGRADSKASKLIAWLQRQCKPQDEWNDTRVIIFTEYRDTQRWLHEILTSAKVGGPDRLMLLYGGMPTDKREQIKAAFQADPSCSPVRILLATDAASEGIDLQNHCAHLIHYEIPWNPNRLEQRNGRIDRHGQRAKTVWVYHFVSQGWKNRSFNSSTPSRQHASTLEVDLEFLYRAACKVNTIREDLGSVGPVIAQQVEEAMLGKRTHLDTTNAENTLAPVRRVLSFERKLQKQIKEHIAQVQETKQALHLDPSRVHRAVSVALELAGQNALIPATVDGIPDGAAFWLPSLTGSWSACSDGIYHPHTEVARPIVFDHDLVNNRDDVVLVHLNHRLVQMSLRLLRAEVWSPIGLQKLFRVTARVVPSDKLNHPAIIGYARLLVLGSDHQRLHEEIIMAGGTTQDKQFTRFKTLIEMDRILEACTDRPIPSDVQKNLVRQWEKHESNLTEALETQMREREQSMQKVLRERMKKEIKDITSILNELRATILTELEQPAEKPQLSLFSDSEREQLERNMEYLHWRAEQIPTEIEKETQAIQTRYANPQTRMFPVAVMFLVPARMV